jgi:hypothetical protein
MGELDFELPKFRCKKFSGWSSATDEPNYVEGAAQGQIADGH